MPKPSNIGYNLYRIVLNTLPDLYITQKQAQQWIKKNSKNQEVLKPFLDAKDLARNPNGMPSRWIIDFNDLSLEDASNYKLPFTYIKENVKPERLNNRDKRAKEIWWQFFAPRPNLREAIKHLSYYFAIPRHSKWFIFLPSNVDFLPGDSTVIVASDDFYILGILTSSIHRIWIEAQSSTLGETIRYTHTTCFETFPFPTPPTALNNGGERKKVTEESKIVQQIREKMVELHEYRIEQMEEKQWGITQLYNEFFNEPSSKLYKLHQQLDKLVIKAYNFNENEDLLTQILNLNLSISVSENKSL